MIGNLRVYIPDFSAATARFDLGSSGLLHTDCQPRGGSAAIVSKMHPEYREGMGLA